MFTPIQPRSVSDQIVDQIISAILTGKLSAASKLPPERALSSAFCVGRQAVREALQKLVGMGLIQVHKPKGTFVRFLTPEAIRHPLLRLLTQEVNGVLNFLDVRKWLEGMTAAETAEQATETDIRQIEVTLSDLKKAAAKNDREALDASDIAFHLAIVAGTHNPLMIQLMEMFRSLMWSSHGFRTVILEAADYAAVCEEHLAVVAAIRAREPARARDAMMQHIEMIRTRVERLYQQAEPARVMQGRGRPGQRSSGGFRRAAPVRRARALPPR